jgi:predicted nucleotidyltransferase
VFVRRSARRQGLSVTSFDPARIFETLDRHSVDYLTIGAWAVIAHGYVRATVDIDFIARLDKENIVRLAAALSELNARLRGVDADKLGIDPTNPQVLANGASFTMDTDAGPLDFLNDVPGAVDYDQMRSRARQANAGGVTVWVIGFEDLIRMKEASGREQDLLDIHQLRERQSPHNE